MAASEQLSLGLLSAPFDDASLDIDDLPEGWHMHCLGELVTVTGGGTPSKSNPAYWGGAIPWVSPKDMKSSEIVDSQDHITDRAIAESTAKRVAPNSVLVVFRSGILAHTLPVAVNRVEVTLNQDMKALLPRVGLDSAYLAYYLRSAQGRILAAAEKKGATVESIDAGKFLQTPVPIPPLPEQRRIVARIEELAAKIERARGLRRQAMEEVEAASVASLAQYFADEVVESWPALGQVVEYIENGWSPQCLPEPASDGEWGVLKVGAVSTGRFVPQENKKLPPHFEPRPELEIRDGDFLVGRANTTELTGVCALVTNPPPRLMLCDKIFRFHFKAGAQVDTRYLDYALKSKPLRAQIESVATGTSSSMKNISKEKALQLRLPLPPLVEQRDIVARLNDIRANAHAVQRLQSETAAELEALLPAVLARAFRGEL